MQPVRGGVQLRRAHGEAHRADGPGGARGAGGDCVAKERTAKAPRTPRRKRRKKTEAGIVANDSPIPASALFSLCFSLLGALGALAVRRPRRSHPPGPRILPAS